MSNSRGFKGVWIPADIWTHPDLSWIERCLAAEIDSLDNPDHEPRGCYKSNEEFAKEFGVTVRQIQRILKKLKDHNLVRENGSNGRQRFLLGYSRIRSNVPPDMTSMSPQGRQKCHPGQDTGVTPSNSPSLLIENTNENTNNNSRDSVPLCQLALARVDLLFKKMRENNPNCDDLKPKRREKWAKHLERLHRINGYSWEEIDNLIIFSQEDEFWKGNILSARALREKADQLYLKSKRESSKPKMQQTVHRHKENERYAEEITKKYKLPPSVVRICNDRAEVKEQGKQSFHNIYYTEHGFKEQYLNALRKLGYI